VKHNICSRI